jgi:hypothetical protein
VLSILRVKDTLILDKETRIEPNKYNQLLYNKKYTQVFSSKIEFAENLSIIDLLFNTGPQAVDYLKSN